MNVAKGYRLFRLGKSLVEVIFMKMKPAGLNRETEPCHRGLFRLLDDITARRVISTRWRRKNLIVLELNRPRSNTMHCYLSDDSWRTRLQRFDYYN